MFEWLMNREPAWASDIHAHIRVVEQRTKETIMGIAQDTVDQLTAQVTKSKEEVLGKIADLEAQVAAGETPDFTALREAVQGVDDIVPDPVVEEPVEDAPAEGDVPVEAAPVDEEGTPA